MPAKYSSTQKFPKNIEKRVHLAGDASHEKVVAASRSQFSEKGNKELNSCIKDKYEDDWRYMAVTAFLVKCANSRITICFTVVACSDATLALRALVLPYRLWFDVAFLCPLSSPVLSLQHVILPACLPFEETVQIGCIFLSVGLLMEVLPFGTSLEALKLLCSWYQYLMLKSSLIVRNGQEQGGEVRVDDGGDL